MLTEREKAPRVEPAENRQAQKLERKPYHQPKLDNLGDLRSLTLGPSIGFPEDSGGTWPNDTWRV